MVFRGAVSWTVPSELIRSIVRSLPSTTLNVACTSSMVLAISSRDSAMTIRLHRTDSRLDCRSRATSSLSTRALVCISTFKRTYVESVARNALFDFVWSYAIRRPIAEGAISAVLALFGCNRFPASVSHLCGTVRTHPPVQNPHKNDVLRSPRAIRPCHCKKVLDFARFAIKMFWSYLPFERTFS